MRGPAISPSLMASRTPTSVNQVPPGTEMLVTPDRSTFWALHGALSTPKARPGRPPALTFPAQLRVPVREMRVGVDQSGHDPLSRGVDDVDVRAACVQPHRFGESSNAPDAIAFHHQRVVRGGGASGAVDHCAVADNESPFAGGRPRHGSRP